ncbi:hypothetical protein D3C78_1513210 [compost metagenome]
MHDTGHRLFQIRIVEHDEGRVAAKLQAQALDLIGTLTHQQAPHGSRAGEGYLAYRRVAGQLFANTLRHASHYVEHPGRDPDSLGQHRKRQG